MLSIYKREFVTEMPLAFVLTLAGMATLILPREMMLQKVGILGVLLMMLMSVSDVGWRTPEISGRLVPKTILQSNL